MKWILLAVALAAAFLLMLGSLKPFDFAWAAALGAAAVAWRALGGRDRPSPLARMRLAGAPRFAAGVAIEVVSGAVGTLATLVRSGPERRGQIVEISLAKRSKAGAAIDGLVISASPGTVVITADEQSQLMLLHTIEVKDPERIRRDIDRFYERYQRSFLP